MCIVVRLFPPDTLPVLRITVPTLREPAAEKPSNECYNNEYTDRLLSVLNRVLNCAGCGGLHLPPQKGRDDHGSSNRSEDGAVTIRTFLKTFRQELRREKCDSQADRPPPEELGETQGARWTGVIENHEGSDGSRRKNQEAAYESGRLIALPRHVKSRPYHSGPAGRSLPF